MHVINTVPQLMMTALYHIYSQHQDKKAEQKGVEKMYTTIKEGMFSHKAKKP